MCRWNRQRCKQEEPTGAVRDHRVPPYDRICNSRKRCAAASGPLIDAVVKSCLSLVERHWLRRSIPALLLQPVGPTQPHYARHDVRLHDLPLER